MKTRTRSSSDDVPYIRKFEQLALEILKDGINTKEQLKELLVRYADKYAERSTSGA